MAVSVCYNVLTEAFAFGFSVVVYDFLRGRIDRVEKKKLYAVK